MATKEEFSPASPEGAKYKQQSTTPRYRDKRRVRQNTGLKEDTQEWKGREEKRGKEAEMRQEGKKGGDGEKRPRNKSKLWRIRNTTMTGNVARFF